MKWYIIILLITIVILGAAVTAYQLFKIIEIDAKSREMKNPKFWAIFASGGQNGSGLLLYLLRRRKYTSKMSSLDIREVKSRKNKITVGLGCMVLGAIGLSIAIFC